VLLNIAISQPVQPICRLSVDRFMPSFSDERATLPQAGLAVEPLSAMGIAVRSATSALEVMAQAELAAAAGDWRAAQGLYQAAVVLDSASAEAYYGLGNCAKQLRSYEAAVLAFRMATVVDPGFAAAYNSLGNACLLNGNPLVAIEAYQKSLDLEPESALACQGLGAAFWTLGRYGEALAAQQRAIALCPDAAAYNALGNTWIGLEDWEAAIAAFDRAIALDGCMAFAHHGRGVALARSGDYRAALLAFERSIDCDRDYVLAHNSLGNTLVRLGRLAEARSAYDRALHLDPAYEPALRNLQLIG
jgi:superkiller protein 3